jgi:hypothetical protein
MSKRTQKKKPSSKQAEDRDVIAKNYAVVLLRLDTNTKMLPLKGQLIAGVVGTWDGSELPMRTKPGMIGYGRGTCDDTGNSVVCFEALLLKSDLRSAQFSEAIQEAGLPDYADSLATSLLELVDKRGYQDISWTDDERPSQFTACDKRRGNFTLSLTAVVAA